LKPILETGINRLKTETENKIEKNWKPVNKIRTETEIVSIGFKSWIFQTVNCRLNVIP